MSSSPRTLGQYNFESDTDSERLVSAVNAISNFVSKNRKAVMVTVSAAVLAFSVSQIDFNSSEQVEEGQDKKIESLFAEIQEDTHSEAVRKMPELVDTREWPAEKLADLRAHAKEIDETQ